MGRDANAARWLTDRREVLGGVCGPESRFSDDVQTPPPVPRPEGSRPVTPRANAGRAQEDERGHLLVICDSASEASRSWERRQTPSSSPAWTRSCLSWKQVPGTRQDDDARLDKCAGSRLG